MKADGRAHTCLVAIVDFAMWRPNAPLHLELSSHMPIQETLTSHCLVCRPSFCSSEFDDVGDWFTVIDKTAKVWWYVRKLSDESKEGYVPRCIDTLYMLHTNELVETYFVMRYVEAQAAFVSTAEDVRVVRVALVLTIRRGPISINIPHSYSYNIVFYLH